MLTGDMTPTDMSPAGWALAVIGVVWLIYSYSGKKKADNRPTEPVADPEL